MELLLKVGDSESHAGYRDGDIVCAFATDHILKVNAQTLMSAPVILDSVSGLNPSGTLLELVCEISSEFRFVREADTVTRTSLATGEQTVHDATTPESIHVDAFLKRRLKHPRHRIFGDTGSEYWFGGTREFSAADIWSVLEQHSDHVREDYRQWPFTCAERSHFLPISCAGYGGHEDDISHPTAQQRCAPVTEDTGTPEPIDIAKREWFVPYWDLSNTLNLTVDDVRDNQQIIDARLMQGSPALDSTNISKVANGLI